MPIFESGCFLFCRCYLCCFKKKFKALFMIANTGDDNVIPPTGIINKSMLYLSTFCLE